MSDKKFLTSVWLLFGQKLKLPPSDCIEVAHEINLYWDLPDLEGSESLQKYYIEKVVPHKVAVYESGRFLIEKLDLTEEQKEEFEDRLLIHDASKFSADEQAYAYYNFSGENSEGVKKAFKAAWARHKKVNDHHPEYWFDVDRSGNTTVMEMPYLCVVEMVADWMGAGLTYGNPLDRWLVGNLHTFVFHEKTVEVLIEILKVLDIETKKINVNALKIV